MTYIFICIYICYSDTELIDESYSLYGVKLPVPRGQFPAPAYDATRLGNGSHFVVKFESSSMC